MAFTGNLNAVALTDVVQLVGLAQKSGTLTVVTGRGRFTVLFRDGYVVDASAVRFARPVMGGGSSLVKEQHVRADLSGEPSKGVGLAEMAGKIFRLSAGHFSFQVGEPQTDSGVTLDVSVLLLETFRQQDEAARDGAPALNDYEALPGGGPEKERPAGKSVSAEPPRSNPLLRLFTLFRALSDGQGEADRDVVVLDAAREVFDRAILFRVTEKELCGVSGYIAGYTRDARQLDEALASLRIPLGVQSPIQDAVDVGHISVGEASPEWWTDYVPVEFGPPSGMDYVAVPIMAGDKCVRVLYGDTYAHREFADPLRALEVICKHVGLLTENEILRGRKLRGRTTLRAWLFGARRTG